MANYARAFSQSESGKYFEWIIILIIKSAEPYGEYVVYRSVSFFLEVKDFLNILDIPCYCQSKKTIVI